MNTEGIVPGGSIKESLYVVLGAKENSLSCLQIQRRIKKKAKQEKKEKEKKNI